MARRRDPNTPDLFQHYQPEAAVERFEAEDVQAWSLAGRLSKAVALTLNESPLGRAEIAKAMSEFLKTDVSKTMLDKYASQASEEHAISALRLAALAVVTGDTRAFNVLLGEAGLIVVDKKYEALMRRENARLLRERMEREEAAADAQWKAQR